MSISKKIILSVVVVAIVGSIFFLESKKAGPVSNSSGEDDIRIEDSVVVESDEESGVSDEGNMENTKDLQDAESSESMEVQTDAGSVLPDSETPKQVITKTRADTIAEKSTQYERAKEISSPDAFINTNGITVGELVGSKIVLIDFWTYSCINCQRTTPYLNSWHDKYADDGLVILGIHTPEFEFEKELDNVEKATAALGIKYPVIMDNDYSTWQAYKNRYWPRKYIVDIDGFITYDHIGEGRYEETEAKIVELLNEKNKVLGINKVVTVDPRTPEEIDQVDFSKVKTRESYFGTSRIEYLSNLPADGCPGDECEFTLLDEVPLNHFAVGGHWKFGSEEAELLSGEGVIVSHFSASKVNLVGGSEEGVEATVYLDGEIIPDMFAGSDVVGGKVIFKDHDLYNLVDLKGDYSEHLLEIRFEEPGIEAFAFTFG